MKTTQFDAKTKAFFTTEVTGCSHSNKILGEGYFIIVNPDSKYVSFSKENHDICHGDIVSDLIPEYTNQQYADDYYGRVITYKDRRFDKDNKPFHVTVTKTVKEYMQQNCRMDIK